MLEAFRWSQIWPGKPLRSLPCLWSQTTHWLGSTLWETTPIEWRSQLCFGSSRSFYCVRLDNNESSKMVKDVWGWRKTKSSFASRKCRCLSSWGCRTNPWSPKLDSSAQERKLLWDSRSTCIEDQLLIKSRTLTRANCGHRPERKFNFIRRNYWQKSSRLTQHWGEVKVVECKALKGSRNCEWVSTNNRNRWRGHYVPILSHKHWNGLQTRPSKALARHELKLSQLDEKYFQECSQAERIIF